MKISSHYFPESAICFESQSMTTGHPLSLLINIVSRVDPSPESLVRGHIYPAIKETTITSDRGQQFSSCVCAQGASWIPESLSKSQLRQVRGLLSPEKVESVGAFLPRQSPVAFAPLPRTSTDVFEDLRRIVRSLCLLAPAATWKRAWFVGATIDRHDFQAPGSSLLLRFPTPFIAAHGSPLFSSFRPPFMGLLFYGKNVDLLAFSSDTRGLPPRGPPPSIGSGSLVILAILLCAKEILFSETKRWGRSSEGRGLVGCLGGWETESEKMGKSWKFKDEAAGKGLGKLKVSELREVRFSGS